MVRQLHVTRHGLTACPGCNTHIRVADNPIDTVCPFCAVALKDVISGTKALWLGRVTQAGRGRVVAASLLGLGGMAACFATFAPVYGGPPPVDDVVMSDTGQDAGQQPTADTIEIDTAPDAEPQPEYGIPSDVNP